MKPNMISSRKIDLQDYLKEAGYIKAFTHPARLAILDILEDDEACVCHIENLLGLRQAYISQQLAVLRDAGLVTSRQDGWNVYYRIADTHLLDVVHAIQAVINPEKLVRPRPLKSGDCPCPKCNSD